MTHLAIQYLLFINQTIYIYLPAISNTIIDYKLMMNTLLDYII